MSLSIMPSAYPEKVRTSAIESPDTLKWQQALKQWDVGTMEQMLQAPDFLSHLIQEHSQEVREVLLAAKKNPDQVRLIQIIGSHPDYTGAKKEEITKELSPADKADLGCIIDARDIEGLSVERLNDVVFRCTWNPIYSSILEEVIEKRLDVLTPASLTRIAARCGGSVKWDSLKLLLTKPLSKVCLIDIASAAYRSNHKVEAKEILGGVLAGPRLQCHLLDPIPRAIFRSMMDTVAPQNQARYLVFAAQYPNWETLVNLLKLGIAKHATPDQLGLILFLAVRSANHRIMPEAYTIESIVKPEEFQIIVQAILSAPQKISPNYAEIVLREVELGFPKTVENTITEIRTHLQQ